ncbi:podocan-like protein 1 [Amblyraja radiata]|uniref:podocan-like protein 1 n=1 Tax=Amblyraja radiata TaxID=386614 RepID=UPI0014037AED|nr:podocan-like protein 1 [Amblyraja radiata]
MKKFEGRGKPLVWALLWASLLLKTSAVNPQNTMKGRQIEVQITGTFLPSTQTPTKETVPQEDGGLPISGVEILRVAPEDKMLVAGYETIVTGDGGPSPASHSPAQSPNLQNPKRTNIATSVPNDTSPSGSSAPTLHERPSNIQAPHQLETNVATDVVNTSPTPTHRPTVNHSLTPAKGSSQHANYMPTGGHLAKRLGPQLAMKNPRRPSAPNISGNYSATILWRPGRGKNVTNGNVKRSKQHKLTKATKKCQKQPSAKLKVKPQVPGKPGQTKLQQEQQKRKSVKPKAFPYFEDHYCPPHCTCYGRVVQCSDRGLNRFPYGIPFNTRSLFLMNNQIDVIPMELLSEYVSLEFLVLNSNRLTDAGLEGSLERMEKLTRLYLDQNQLSRVPVTLPPSLEELTLNSNNISTMSARDWATYRNLRIISLNDNRLMEGSIPAGALGPMQNLHTIKMEHNLLAAVPTDLSTSLRELYLEGNQIQKIADNVFSSSTALTHLSLHNNQVNNRGIGQKAFQHMSKLEYLDLGKNALTAVPKQLPCSLKELILEGNAIGAIRKGSFCNTSDLEEVYLAHNRIALVATGALRGMARLRFVDLSHNRLLHVPRQLPLTLHYLYLHGNHISHFPRDALCDREWARSHLILVRLEKNKLDPDQVDSRALRCLRGHQVIHFE